MVLILHGGSRLAIGNIYLYRAAAHIVWILELKEGWIPVRSVAGRHNYDYNEGTGDGIPVRLRCMTEIENKSLVEMVVGE